jgi:hypothetical protein
MPPAPNEITGRTPGRWRRRPGLRADGRSAASAAPARLRCAPRAARPHLAQHLVECRGDHLLVLQAEAHAADVRLVGDVGRQDLDDHRNPTSRAAATAAARSRAAIARGTGRPKAESSAFDSCSVSSVRFSRNAASRMASAAQGRRRPRRPGRKRRRHLHELRLVSAVGTKEGERLHRVFRGVEVGECRAPRGGRGSRSD